MVSTIDDIINNVSGKKQVDKEMLTSLVKSVFSETKKEFSQYNELSVYLPGLFIFFYGRTRLIKFKVELEDFIENVKRMNVTEHPKTFLDKMSLEELEVTLDKVNKLLSRYEEYINEKRKTKRAYRESKVNS